MKILLIYPNYRLEKNKENKVTMRNRLFSMVASTDPIGLHSLVGVTPKEHQIEIIDERYTNIDYNCHYDLVGISALTIDAVRAYFIADEFRRRGVTVIIGGWHASALHNEAKQHADSVVIGEAEEIWPIIIDDLENNKLKSFYKQEKPTDITKVSFPTEELSKRITFGGGALSSRGCPYKCKFCSIGASPHGKKFRKRSIPEVIDEIKKTSAKIITVYDASLTADIKHTKDFFKALKGSKKKFIFQGNINVLEKDEELLKLSKEAGCIQWRIGFESICQDSLKEVEKKNKVDGYYKTIEKIHSYGMEVHGYFIFGFDHDPKNIFKETLNFIKKSKITASFAILTPLPGTSLCNELSKQGRIICYDWGRYDYLHVNYKPKNFTESELLEGFKSAYYEYFSREIIKRFYHLTKRGFSLSKIYLLTSHMLVTFYITRSLKTDKHK